MPPNNCQALRWANGFVPEGQHDRSQARSAWNNEENSRVPAGRLNRSHRTRTFQQEYLAFLKRQEHSTCCRLLMPGLSSTTNICGTDNDFDRPSGTVRV
jgi:hypothetical protein